MDTIDSTNPVTCDQIRSAYRECFGALPANDTWTFAELVAALVRECGRSSAWAMIRRQPRAD